MSNHSWNFIRHEQILVGQCLMTECYFTFFVILYSVTFKIYDLDNDGKISKGDLMQVCMCVQVTTNQCFVFYW